MSDKCIGGGSHDLARSLALVAARCYAYAVARCPSVYLSVCPSVCTCVYVVAKNLQFVSPSGNHISLVFPHQTLWQYSDDDPLTRASNAGTVCKNCYSRPTSGFIACCRRSDRQVLYAQLRRTVVSWWHLSQVNGVVCCSLETVGEVFMTRASTLRRRQRNWI